MGTHGGAEGPLEAAALERDPRAAATADVRATARTALRGVGLDATVDDDHAPQIGLCRQRATAHAATPRSGYEDASGSAADASASSAGTSTGAGVALAAVAGTSSPSSSTRGSSSAGAISSVGWWASA